MSDLTKFSDGAAILQQVDVSDIFKNLAMGIAEAQQKLDDNSVAQAIRLAQTQINGVSLLQMGFQPTFYAFQYADISASINLKMAMKESLEFGFGLDLKLSQKKGYKETDHKFMSEDKYSETKEEYKTSKEMCFRAGEKNNVKIDNHYFKLSEELQAKSRLEKFKDDIKSTTNVEQVYEDITSETISNNRSRGIDVWIDRGFLRIEEGIHYKKSGIGLLKIRDYSTEKAIDVNGTGADGDFNLATDLVSSLTVAKDPDVIGTNGELYGMSKTGNLYKFDGTNWIPISSTMYFKYNKDDINYSDNLKDGPSDSADLIHTYPSGSVNNKNHAEHFLINKILRLIQNNDPDARITITGMTDPKGGNSKPNESLARRRAENLCEHIFGSKTPINVKVTPVTNNSGNSDLQKRNAKIELDCDYMIFIDGKVNKDASPAKTTSKPNKFVYADDISTNPFYVLDVQYGTFLLQYSQNQSFSDLIEHVKTVIDKYSYEEKEEQHYFLRDEAVVKFYLYTNESEDISIEHSDESSESGSESEDTFVSSKTKNEKSELSDNVTKNSSDNSFALGASVDFRMSKQFEMSMEGNASMSARLVAVPAPQGFVIFIQNIFVNNNSGTVTINN
jgi:hypothetical protein